MLKHDSSDSSDADEFSSKLKEAVAPGLDSLFAAQKKKTLVQEASGAENDLAEKKSLPSLRRDKNKEDENPFINGLDVTPAFQRYVASKLSDIIDGELEIQESKINESVLDEQDVGIRLFKSSKTILSVNDGEETLEKRKRPDLLKHRKDKERKLKKRKRKSVSGDDGSSSSSEDEGLKEVAVSADWVHKQREIFRNDVEPDQVITMTKPQETENETQEESVPKKKKKKKKKKVKADPPNITST